MSSYQKRKTFIDRYTECRRVREQYPNFIPVIVETKLPLDKQKYLVHPDLTLAELLVTVRKRLTISPAAGLFFLVGQTLTMPGVPLGQIYPRFQDPDGFLYLTLVEENTFGGGVFMNSPSPK